MSESEHPLMEAVLRAIFGAGLGIGLGVLMLGVGAFRALILILTGSQIDMAGFWPGAVIYVFGFAMGGAVMGALWPFQPSTWRQYAAGAAGGMTLNVAIARVIDGPTAAWGPRTYILIVVLGSLLGVGFTRGLRGEPPA